MCFLSSVKIVNIKGIPKYLNKVLLLRKKHFSVAHFSLLAPAIVA